MCYEKAEVMWDGNSLCRRHFEPIKKNILTGGAEGETIAKELTRIAREKEEQPLNES